MSTEFRGRLRTLADAADGLHDAYAAALRAGLSWRPLRGSAGALPPYELRPDTGRRGPDGLSREFDAAVEHLNRAGAESDLADLVAAYAAVAAAAAAIADALEAAGE
jgi:hypothetical protein